MKFKSNRLKFFLNPLPAFDSDFFCLFLNVFCVGSLLGAQSRLPVRFAIDSANNLGLGTVVVSEPDSVSKYDPSSSLSSFEYFNVSSSSEEL